ncbi:TonB-dependent receptor plug domain-containing protein [Gallaecimonas mangrovi]|uniref:TonB-dependent receptor plug domain-containing protein n=1 Tax=Gallaecimonas mangrovi TaxID=2291597 RepID=UPI000E20110E|nr:TonB-dependent receptor [Gallaecimonas mangrovi]
MSRIATLSPLAVLVASCLSNVVYADDQTEVIEVQGQKINQHTDLSTDKQLSDQGVDFSAAGGVSALPILNGMMSDRVKVLVDGADISSACANEMNPPLSYVSGSQIHAVNVVAGISPVSMGGDNIAGVISVDTINPQFSSSNGLSWQQGYLSAGFKTGSDTKTVAAGAELSSKHFSLKYDGAYEDANSYDDGDGNKVLDTLYRAQNHALTAAYKDDKQQFAIKLTRQYIPFQGFPNQYMDMTDNSSYGVNTQYLRHFASGDLEARVTWHGVHHKMGFFTDEKSGAMPMNTKGNDYSYQLHWTQPLSKTTTLKLGQEYYLFRLDDTWPAISGSMMMGPDDYININNGKRQRIAAFAELNQQLSEAWNLNYGLRFENVHTDAGEVQGYGSMMMAADTTAAAEFNASDRSKTDNLVDVTVLASYQIDAQQQLQFGLARKNRAPNLYERYSWGQTTMATTMIGWNGDGNGYVGDINLKPETAYTASAKYQYQASDGSWQASISPFYTKVHDFIDANVIGTFNSGDYDSDTRNILQFANVDATLYGADAKAAVVLADSNGFGQWQLAGKVSYTHGERDDSNTPLYQIMPLSGTLALSQQWGAAKNSIQWQWSDKKDRVDPNRLENQTAGYGLLNLRSEWDLKPVTLTFAVDNLLDRNYDLPLGGVSIAQYDKDDSQGFEQLKGEGRSLSINARYAF